MILNFLVFVLALTSFVGAMLTFKVALNTGRKIGAIKKLTEGDGNKAGKPRKYKKGADRNFEPSKFW